jgi:hypothetical protein
VEKLCEVVTGVGAAGPVSSRVVSIDKIEGGLYKAPVMSKDDGTKVVAKIPTSFAGPPRLNTESEAVLLHYCIFPSSSL